MTECEAKRGGVVCGKPVTDIVVATIDGHDVATWRLCDDCIAALSPVKLSVSVAAEP